MADVSENESAKISLEEAVNLGAEDASFFGEFFFPHTCRMKTPPFHQRMDAVLDNPDNRFVSFKVFRGGAKTSKTRLYLARRISYGVSRTVIVVGKSKDHATKTVEWLQRQVEFNKTWARTYRLQPGKKWTPSDLEITQYLPGDERPVTVRVMALGITGSARGINIDDYRPDLILVDDPCDEENTATAEQRKKTSDLFFGALEKSLAPASEAPHAKMVLSQTVFNSEDLISLTMEDSNWASLDISIFDENGESQWPERWSTDELLQQKQSAIDRFQLPLWLREMEGKVTSEETAAFAERALKYYEHPPEDGIVILSCDPVPPPDTGKDGIIKITQKHDSAVVMALKLSQGCVYVLEYWGKQRPFEEEYLEAIVSMILKYDPVFHIAFESVLFQKMMQKALEKKLEKMRLFRTVLPVDDRRPKPQRIRQEIGDYASYRKLFLRKEQTELIEQYLRYPDVSHDDYVDALAMGLDSIEPWMFDVDALEGEFEELNGKVTDPREIAWDGAP